MTRLTLPQLAHVVAARLYVRLGWAGLAGLGCMAIALFWGLWIHNAKQLLAQPTLPVKSIADAPALATASLTPPALPHAADSVQILRMLEGQAKANGLTWPQAEYRITPISDEGLATLEIRTTLRGSYPQLRKLIATLLEKQPALALRELTLSRPNGDTVEVEAKVRWAMFLADGWAPASQGGKP